MAYYAELSRGYKLTDDKFGLTGQRQFVESNVEFSPGSTGVTLPVIGDLMHDENEAYQHLYCIKREREHLASDATKMIWTCYYSNEPIDNSNMTAQYTPPTDSSELPQDWDYSGEYQMWKASALEQPNSKWEWEDDPGTKIANAIPFRIKTYSRKIFKIIPGEKYDDYVNVLTQAIGCVNGDDWEGGGTGCWLMTGAHSEIFRDQNDNSAWKFDLNFQYRDPDAGDPNNMGWQKILNEVGLWKIPKNIETGSYLYATANFDTLFI